MIPKNPPVGFYYRLNNLDYVVDADLVDGAVKAINRVYDLVGNNVQNLPETVLDSIQEELNREQFTRL